MDQELNTGAFADTGNTLAQVGTVIQQAAEARRSQSMLGRAISAITGVTVGVRAVPGARRLLKRNPALGALLIAGTIGALFLVYSRRVRV